MRGVSRVLRLALGALALLLLGDGSFAAGQLCGEQYVVGFRTGETEPALRALAKQCEAPRRRGE